MTVTAARWATTPNVTFEHFIIPDLISQIKIFIFCLKVSIRSA